MQDYIIHQHQGNGKTKLDYKAELNDEQYRAVTQGDGYCLVLAGAGSGKTKTLVYRVAYLLEQGINPKHIMLVTFTNKASREMLDRVTSLVGADVHGMWGGTFHHIANRLLRKYASKLGLSHAFNILDEDDNRQLLKTCIADLQIASKDNLFPKPKVISSAFGFAINSNTAISEILAERYSYLPPQVIEDLIALFEYYQKKKQQLQVMSFDDMLFNWYRLLRDFPEVKERIAAQFQYILVDEYQDTNAIQNEIVSLMSSVHHNLLVVGDDAQSIYSFRAATVANILEFEKRHNDVKVFRLQTNYRSTPEILELANASIAHNEQQYHKELSSVQPSSSKPALVPVKDNYQQADFIAQRILELHDNGFEYTEIAILFRSSFHIIELELELNKRGIPYYVRGGLRFFEQAHIKDMVSFLKILANPLDEIAWHRVLTMQPGVGSTTAKKIYNSLQESTDIKQAITLLQESKISKRAQAGIQSITNVLAELQKITEHDSHIASAMTYILKNTYQEYLKNQYENYHERLMDLEQLITFSDQYKDVPTFLSEISLSESFKGDRGGGEVVDEDVVILSTIHQAKGLEWPVVFVIGLAEGQFPHYKVMEDSAELSEERRLFYVAVTRAKNELYCTYPIVSSSVATGYKINQPSQFITEVGQEFFEVWRIRGVDTSMLGWDIDEPENSFINTSDPQVGDISEKSLQGMSILDRVAAVNKKWQQQESSDWDDAGFYNDETIEY